MTSLLSLEEGQVWPIQYGVITYLWIGITLTDAYVTTFFLYRYSYVGYSKTNPNLNSKPNSNPVEV